MTLNSNTLRAYRNVYFSANWKNRKRPSHFGIVTACNPHGQTTSLRRNTLADKRLKRQLSKAQLPHFRVTGGDKPGLHREPGWASNAPLDTIRTIAKNARQIGFYWIARGRVYLGLTGSQRLHKLERWSEHAARWDLPEHVFRTL